MPADIANLKDLTAIVRLKNYDFVLSQWHWEAAKEVHESFILRDDLVLDNIVARQITVTNDGESAKGHATKKTLKLNIKKNGLGR